MSDTPPLETPPVEPAGGEAVADTGRGEAVADTGRGARKERVGVVASAAADKTIVVTVERRRTHDLYGKTLRRSKRYHAHDEHNDAGAGDRVRIVETRPLSKTKRWRLAEIIERAE